MKDIFIKNLGLKILSVVAAFVLWLVVVNVDDPVISKTYSGIEVEILNSDILEQKGECFEVKDGSDYTTIVVTAKRSVLDMMSKDYLRATADLKSLSSSDTIPIEVRSTKYSDQIESVVSRSENVKVTIENLIERTIPVEIIYTGEPEEGYVVASVDSLCDSVKVKGPESVVSLIKSVRAENDISGISKDYVITEGLFPCDEDGERIDDERITLSRTMTEVRYYIYATKTIPITSGYSGEPLAGYGLTGVVVTNPSSVMIAGKGENFDDMEVIYISPDEIDITGSVSDAYATVDISDYLPTGVIFAEDDFEPQVEVTIGIQENQHKMIEVPLSNITVSDVPVGYIANIVDIGQTLTVEIQGIGDTFDRFSGDLAIGTIAAESLVPRSIPAGQEDAIIVTGENDGVVVFDFPTGISQVNPTTLMVVVDYAGDIVVTDSTAAENVATDSAVTENTENTAAIGY